MITEIIDLIRSSLFYADPFTFAYRDKGNVQKFDHIPLAKVVAKPVLVVSSDAAGHVNT